MMRSNVFEAAVVEFTRKELTSVDLEILQVNLGPHCNQACRHCHLNASPSRTERMALPVMERIVEIAGKAGCRLGSGIFFKTAFACSDTVLGTYTKDDFASCAAT